MISLFSKSCMVNSLRPIGAERGFSHYNRQSPVFSRLTVTLRQHYPLVVSHAREGQTMDPAALRGYRHDQFLIPGFLLPLHCILLLQT